MQFFIVLVSFISAVHTSVMLPNDIDSSGKSYKDFITSSTSSNSSSSSFPLSLSLYLLQMLDYYWTLVAGSTIAPVPLATVAVRQW